MRSTSCGQLLLVARRILKNEEDAQDAVQEAFLSAFKDINRFEERSLFGTWLHRILVNAALCRLRSRQRRPERSIEELLPHFGEDEHQIDPPAPWQETSGMILLQKEARELVQQCIGRLPEIYRTVLLLHDIEELDTEETARMLEVRRASSKRPAPRPPGSPFATRPLLSEGRRMNCP